MRAFLKAVGHLPGWRPTLGRSICVSAALLTLLALSPAVANEAYAWRPVAIGGGGFITGIDMDRRGVTRVARTDVHGAYLWREDRDRWVQLVTSASMPAPFLVQNGANEGVFEIAVAPSDPDRLYMAIKGQVLRSSDGGQSFTAAGPASPFPLAFDPNSPFRLYGPFLSVSPVNPDLALFGTPADGLWRTADGGESWVRVATVPVAGDLRAAEPGLQAPGIVTWFEQRNGEATGRIWAMSPGNGVFVSDDGGIAFRPLAARDAVQPSLLTQGAFARDGHFVGVDTEGKSVWSYRDGVWSDLTESGHLPAAHYRTVAASPFSDRLVIFDRGGRAFVSEIGLRWTEIPHRAAPGDGDPPWLHVADESYFATGRVIYDATVPERLWVGAGTGVYRADLASDPAVVDWRSQTRGIEELVANDVAQAPGGSPMFAALDFGIHLKTDLDAFSTGYGPKERVLIAAQQLALTPADPDFVATNASDTRTACCWQDGDSVLAGYSLNGGRDWRRFSSLPQPPGTDADDPWRMAFGSIAVSSGDPSNIVWEPSYNRAPFYTHDRGATWSRVSFPGETLPLSGSHGMIYLQRKNVAADPVRSGVFYIAHSGGGDNAALAGLWRSEDGGATWGQVHRGEIAPRSSFAAKLRPMPDRSGDLFFTSAAGGDDARLRRSRDAGATWSIVPGVDHVDDVVFGKAALGASAPTIFLSGRVHGNYGIWRSVDDGATWRRIGTFPAGRLDKVTVMGADPDQFGRVYIGYMGSGFLYGAPSDCVPVPFRAFDAAECAAVR